MKAVILGADGQLGKAFQHLLPDAIALGHSDFDLSWGANQMLDQLGRHTPELVLNCAAYNNVDLAEKEVGAAYQVNGYSIQVLAEGCRGLGARLVTYSTDYVFDGIPIEGGYREDHWARPLSVYGKSKLAGEALARGLPFVTVIRTSWVFGDGNNFFKLMLSLADQGRGELTVTNDLVSRPTYAPDLADATMRLLAMDEPPGLIHVAGGGEPVTKAGQAEAAFAATGKNVVVKHVTTEEYYAGKTGYADRPHYSVLNLDMLKAFAIEMRDWRIALKEYLA